MKHPFERHRKRLRSPIRLKDLIQNRTRRWKMTLLQRTEIIQQKWAEAAGEYVASHVVPSRLIRKTLRVVAEDSAWLTEMTYLGEEILVRLKELLPGDWVDKIQTVVGEPLPKRALSEPAVLLAKTSKEMLHRVEEVGDLVDDTELRKAIERAMLAGVRRDRVKPYRKNQSGRSGSKEPDSDKDG
jgi:hypothetical protein